MYPTIGGFREGGFGSSMQQTRYKTDSTVFRPDRHRDKKLLK